MIQQSTFDFIKGISLNNNKAWFEENKPKYLVEKANVEAFMAAMVDGLSRQDVIEKSKLYRIYRDVRFSKDKTPYKNYFSGYLVRASASRRGSYFFHISEEKTMIGGGFYAPNKEDLLRIRKEFEADEQTINEVVNQPLFKNTYGTLLGDGVKTAPRGFDKEHANIHWIKKKQFYAFKEFPTAEVLQANFNEVAVDTFHALRPFFDYFSDILTTDLNGESIL